MAPSQKIQEEPEKYRWRQSARIQSLCEVPLILLCEVVIIVFFSIESKSRMFLFEYIEKSLEYDSPEGVEKSDATSPQAIFIAKCIYVSSGILLMVLITAGCFLVMKATEKGVEPKSALPKMKFWIATSSLTGTLLAILTFCLVRTIGLLPFFAYLFWQRIKHFCVYQYYLFELEDMVEANDINIDESEEEEYC